MKKLYRPVGKKELELIIESQNKAYPPRLDWQPIFYPVLNFEYAQQIAVKWNLDDEFSGYSGFVTEFEIPENYFNQFEVQNVGGDLHNELWVPSENLPEFNAQIVGPIQISGRYYGSKYTGEVESTQFFQNKNANQQWEILTQTEDLKELIQAEKTAILINWNYWRLTHLQEEQFQKATFDQILEEWKSLFPTIRLDG